jgi:predicted protein tyrosine phosphatase
MEKENKNNIVLTYAKFDFIMQNMDELMNKMNDIEIKINKFENTNKSNMIGTRKATTELINNMLIDFKKHFETKLNDIKEQQLSTRVYMEEVNANIVNLNATVSDFQREDPYKKITIQVQMMNITKRKKTSSSDSDYENDEINFNKV